MVPRERRNAQTDRRVYVAANVAAARHLKKFKLPTLSDSRGPSDERLTALRQFLGSMALGLGGGENRNHPIIKIFRTGSSTP